ncbi:fructosamine kinase family protein [Roseivirga thermotolerans]|uniref:Fructosamine kinase n=1 Tax=Roseivirga thermotolerans TaxID=1758176 RepID=A0ABQ3I988_9BACT|nr:fructosamine kinase family protein [Roseivirga thermotolerans]GHE67021.1 fructosamine kinase [Roseivirga thermotolerans]
MHDYYTELLGSMLFQVLGDDLTIEGILMQSGGDINMAVCVQTAHGDFFVKWHEGGYEDMMEKEALGLKLLKKVPGLKVPEVFGHGRLNDISFLVLEFLERGREDEVYWTRLGEALAELHRVKGDSFGLDHDNYIGRLQQCNKPTQDWVSFFAEFRLNAQLGLAIYNQQVNQEFVRDFKQFLHKLPGLMPESEPSLLHGDLWSGNAFGSTKGPALFDPAVYYGAREMDLAMTRLFGGFNQRFYEAYDAIYPLPDDFDALVEIYNLYPLMVHVNLFGANSGYLGSVWRTIKRYI